MIAATRRETMRLAGLLMTSTALPALARPLGAAEGLDAGWSDPPMSARPRVWWHWMNGNVTREGITKDIAWMVRVGIGGLHAFDAALETPQVVDQRLAYMSPAWKDAFRHAASLADREGLELAVAASPGWSLTGGPWVPPQDGMKKLVWSEREIEGGAPFDGVLPALPTATGPFQDVAATGGGGFLSGPFPGPMPRHVGAVAVVAHRLPDAAVATPDITAAGKPVDGRLTSNASGITVVELPRAPKSAITFAYRSAQTLRAATIHAPGAFARAVLEVEADAGWRHVADLDMGELPATTAFAPVTSTRFRVVLHPVTPAAPPFDLWGTAVEGAISPLGKPPRVPPTIGIAQLRLWAEPRVDAGEAKAGYLIPDEYHGERSLADEPGFAPSDVVDLTDRLKPDGRLDWTPPAGRWRVLRLGWSLTGKFNHPATAEATGLEVDKYDRAAVRRYLTTYLRMYADTTGPELFGRHGLRALMVDSIETGVANWTGDMLSHFRRLRGYDARPWLPALTGAVIGSRQRTDAFLYDFRRTLSDLIATEHYATVAEVAHRHGLTVYGESLEGQGASLGDDMDMRRYADVPTGAVWTFKRPGGARNLSLLADMKAAASVASLYGRTFVAAEALTSGLAPWAQAPADLKPVIDRAFLAGVNRPLIHTSVHQPVDDRLPGLSLMIFGQYFNRHETWAEMARPWIDYIARSSYLLQQGRRVAEVACFTGEDGRAAAIPPDAPTRYDWDFVNATALMEALRVDAGWLVSRGGARYRVLYLGTSGQPMRLPVLRRLAAFARAGVLIAGAPPRNTPSLADDAEEFRRLVDRLWGGARPLVGGGDVEAALAKAGLVPDFDNATPGEDRPVSFLHRRLPDADIYFLANQSSEAVVLDARFRVAGSEPELWRADTGEIVPLSYRCDGQVTTVPLSMPPHDAVFVVFRGARAQRLRQVAPPAWRPARRIDGPWQVNFQEGRGAPARIALPRLAPLNEHEAAGVHYFSGIASYRTEFDAPAGWAPGGSVLLDLGSVGDVAEVLVNGKPAGITWKPPYRLDISLALKPGANTLEVRVANLWMNRLIGDAQSGTAARVTFTSVPTFGPDAPLRPSGLIGPVTLLLQA